MPLPLPLISIFGVLMLAGSSLAASNTCNVTWPQIAYTNISNYLTFNAPYRAEWNLRFSDGRYTGNFPDAFSYNGSRVLPLNATGDVYVNTETKTGKMHITFYANGLQPAEGLSLTGKFDIISKDFDSTPANQYVPFMEHGIANSIIEHGCTGQGEAGFPQVKGKFATWGHCDVYLNGTLLFPDLWLHTMYIGRMRDAATNAMWADAAHTHLYSALTCWEGGIFIFFSDPADVRDDLPEFEFIVARWCYCPDCQIHRQTDLNIVLAFMEAEDLDV